MAAHLRTRHVAYESMNLSEDRLTASIPTTVSQIVHSKGKDNTRNFRHLQTSPAKFHVAGNITHQFFLILGPTSQWCRPNQLGNPTYRTQSGRTQQIHEDHPTEETWSQICLSLMVIQ